MAEVEVKEGFKTDGSEKSEFVCALCEDTSDGSNGLMLPQKVRGWGVVWNCSAVLDIWCAGENWGAIKKNQPTYIKESLSGKEEKWESLQIWSSLESCIQQGRCFEVLMNLESSPCLCVISCTLNWEHTSSQVSSVWGGPHNLEDSCRA